jgi:hypothetical protein
MEGCITAGLTQAIRIGSFQYKSERGHQHKNLTAAA